MSVCEKLSVTVPAADRAPVHDLPLRALRHVSRAGAARVPHEPCVPFGRSRSVGLRRRHSRISHVPTLYLFTCYIVNVYIESRQVGTVRALFVERGRRQPTAPRHQNQKNSTPQAAWTREFMCTRHSPFAAAISSQSPVQAEAQPRRPCSPQDDYHAPLRQA